MSEASERHRRLYEALRERICLLDYPPGMKLSEAELAAEFGTSRTPLRRVLARLEDEGLVRSVHGVGTLVTDVDIDEMRQVYDLRMELAQLSGRLSPAQVTPSLLTRLRTLVERGDALARRPDARAFARLNMDFFAFGLELSGNEALREVSERLYFRTTRIWLKTIPRLDLADEVAVFVRELKETEAALRAGDLEAAALLRRAHISMSVARMR